MEIDDAQFNLYFSLKGAAGLIPMLSLPFILERYPMKTICLTISILLTIGQFLFAIGLASNSHWLCMLGRFLYGFGDSTSIF